jgi:hypothetical protein
MNSNEIVKTGKAIYNTKLKKILEHKAMGKFVVIDIDSGEYYVDKKSEEALKKAKKAKPKGKFYLHRVGYTSAFIFETLLSHETDR